MLYSSLKPGVTNFYLDCPQGVFQIWKFYLDFDTGIFPFFCLFYPVRAKAFLKILPISIQMRIRDLWVFSEVLCVCVTTWKKPHHRAHHLLLHFSALFQLVVCHDKSKRQEVNTINSYSERNSWQIVLRCFSYFFHFSFFGKTKRRPFIQVGHLLGNYTCCFPAFYACTSAKK